MLDHRMAGIVAPVHAAARRAVTRPVLGWTLVIAAVALDGNPSTALGSNGGVIIAGLASGEHSLQLDGLAENCELAGDNPRSLSLPEGDTTVVALAVTCQALPVTHPAGVVVRSVPLDGGPYCVAVSSDGIVYAALIGSNSLARGDVASMSFGSSVKVGLTPPHVAFNPAGTVVYATLQTGRGLAVVDATTNSLITAVPLASDGFNLLVSPDGRFVYTTTADGTLYVIDAGTYAVITTLDVGAAANGLAFSPEGSILYVSSRDAGTVVAVDLTLNTVTRTYFLGGAPQRLAVAPDGSELYVAKRGGWAGCGGCGVGCGHHGRIRHSGLWLGAHTGRRTTVCDAAGRRRGPRPRACHARTTEDHHRVRAAAWHLRATDGQPWLQPRRRSSSSGEL
jgi:YVTN family beta-propeller protein